MLKPSLLLYHQTDMIVYTLDCQMHFSALIAPAKYLMRTGDHMSSIAIFPKFYFLLIDPSALFELDKYIRQTLFFDVSLFRIILIVNIGCTISNNTSFYNRI